MPHTRDLRPLCYMVGLITIATSLLSTGPAQAQLTGRQWEVGFAVGSANLDSSDEDFDLDFRFDIRGGYLFSKRIQLEGQWITANAPLDARLTALMANALYNFRPDRKIVPYALVGAGYSKLDDLEIFTIGPPNSEDSAAFQLGLGSRFFLGRTSRMALRLELSSLWYDTDFFAADRHTSLTAGLSWALGRR